MASGAPDKRRAGGRREHRGRLLEVAGAERRAEAVREHRAGCDPHRIAAGVLPDVAKSGGGHGPRSAFRPGGLAARDRGGRRHLREANRGSLTSTLLHLGSTAASGHCLDQHRPIQELAELLASELLPRTLYIRSWHDWQTGRLPPGLVVGEKRLLQPLRTVGVPRGIPRKPHGLKPPTLARGVQRQGGEGSRRASAFRPNAASWW